MERFISLSVDGQTITSNSLIERWLSTSPYYWMLECEVDGAQLEVKDNILVWKSGTFYWGEWQWGIFKSGEFRSGSWLGGIFFDGIFKGNWHRGVWKSGTFKGNDMTGKLVTSNPSMNKI